MSVATGAKSFFMVGLDQQVAGRQAGAPVLGLASANFGLVQGLVDPGAIFQRQPSWLTSNELNGMASSPSQAPGRQAYPLDLSFDFRTGLAAPIFATLMGKPVRTQDGANSAFQFVYPISDLSTDAASLHGLLHDGGDTKPIAFCGARFGSIDLAASNGFLGMKTKGQGTGDCEHGYGVGEVANTGTYAHSVAFRGDRSDANRLTDALYIKISSAPSLGVFKVKVKLGTGGVYSTLETSIAYDSVSKKQTDWVELWGDTGPLGFDECENRFPFECFFGGDVTTLALNDVFVAPALLQIPGAGSGETGVARSLLSGCRFGPSSITIKKGATTATINLPVEAVTVKLARTISPAYGFAANGSNPYDMDVVGYFATSIDVDRRFVDREFERAIRTNDRFAVQFLVEGPLMTGSTWRETFQLDVAQARVNDTARPISGPGITKEKITFSAEQPSDGSQATEVTIKSPVDWSF